MLSNFTCKMPLTSRMMKKHQYFSLLLTTMQLVAMNPSSAISPELMLLSLLALTETTSDQTDSEKEKLMQAFGLTECLDYKSLKASWHPINDASLRFAGVVLGTTGKTEPFPTCIKEKFYIGSMSNAQAAKVFVSMRTSQTLDIPVNCDMLMAWVCSLEGSWVMKAERQKVRFLKQAVDGFAMPVNHQRVLDTNEARGVVLDMSNDTSAIYMMPKSTECNSLHILDLIYTTEKWSTKYVSVTAPNVNVTSKINVLEDLKLGDLATSEGRLDFFDSETRVKIDHTGVVASAAVLVGTTRGGGPSHKTWNVDSAFWFFVLDND